MLGTALYYPHIDIHDGRWLRSAILFWDEIQTIVPTAIRSPYTSADTKVCEQEGYLNPLRCDLHPELLEELGRRVFKFMETPDWSYHHVGNSGSELRESNSLMHANKLGHEMKSRLEALVGIHPDKMPPALRSLLIQSDGLALLSEDKLSPHLRHMLRDFEMQGMQSEALSDAMRHMLGRRPHYEEGNWILVDGRFAEVYMSALAALLSKEVQVSPLTNEEISSGHCCPVN